MSDFPTVASDASAAFRETWKGPLHGSGSWSTNDEVAVSMGNSSTSTVLELPKDSRE